MQLALQELCYRIVNAIQVWTDVVILGRIIIWCPFKLIFFKDLFNIYWVGWGETDFLLTFTFCQLYKELCVETWVNWCHISDLVCWCSSALYRLASQAATWIAHRLIWPWCVWYMLLSWTNCLVNKNNVRISAAKPGEAILNICKKNLCWQMLCNKLCYITVRFVTVNFQSCIPHYVTLCIFLGLMGLVNHIFRLFMHLFQTFYKM
jgi:hypothetical protein